MALDPVSLAKLWIMFKPIKRLKERRARKRAAKENGQALPVETEGSMDQQVVTQILLGIVRHAMTASGVGVYFSDDLLVQVVSAAVALGGAIWMARRKIKAAKPAG